MADHLPEDLMVKILERLPIKSLIRFTSVSKRWRSIILSDPKFAKSQFQIASHHQTFRHRVLISTAHESEFESRDLAASSSSSFEDNSSVRKVRCPFNRPGTVVSLLCSCNGLVCVALTLDQTNMFIWNPSTGFFRKLPHPVAVPSKDQGVLCYGFGYLSATDDYKVLAKLEDHKGKEEQAEIFSLRADSWKRIQDPPFYNDYDYGYGTLSNETLHWMTGDDIVAFDLAKEEFRRMRLPVGDYQFDEKHRVHLGATFRGCLCVFGRGNTDDVGSLDLWIMREYDVAESWTKLFNLKVSNLPNETYYLGPIFVMETGTFLYKWTYACGKGMDCKLIRSGHEEDKLETYMFTRDIPDMIEYEESLLSLG